MKKLLPQAWMITDSKKIDPISAAKNLPENSGIILRDYDLSFEKRLQLGTELKQICARKKFVFLVAGDARLAIKLNADGIHFPEFAKAEIHRWRSKKRAWIITASAHSPYAAKFAVARGADAVLISPIFKTSSHPDKNPIGLVRARHYIYGGQNKPLAAYGLGGLNPSRAKALKLASFKGLAGISWVNN